MMAGFRTYIPLRRGSYTVSISKTALSVGGGWRYLLTAETYNLGNDGGKRFILEPAKGKDGAISLVSSGEGSSALRCTQKAVVAFVRQKLGLKGADRLTMQAKDVDGVLMFGVLDNEVRGGKS